MEKEPEVIYISLPLPSKKLSPNTRTHWAAKSKATAKARSDATVVARIAKPASCPWEAAEVRCVFTFPVRRARDKDNLLAWLKAYFDGIASAGVVFNDSAFRHLPVEEAEPNKAAAGVVIEIRRIKK